MCCIYFFVQSVVRGYLAFDTRPSTTKHTQPSLRQQPQNSQLFNSTFFIITMNMKGRRRVEHEGRTSRRRPAKVNARDARSSKEQNKFEVGEKPLSKAPHFDKKQRVQEAASAKISDRLQRLFDGSKEVLSPTTDASESSQGSKKSIRGLPKFEHPCAEGASPKPVKKKKAGKHRSRRREKTEAESDDHSLGSFGQLMESKPESQDRLPELRKDGIPLNISIVTQVPPPLRAPRSSSGGSRPDEIHVDLTASFQESTMSIGLDDLYGEDKSGFPRKRAAALGHRPARRPHRAATASDPVKSTSAHGAATARSRLLPTPDPRSLKPASYHYAGDSGCGSSLVSASENPSEESFACSHGDSASVRMAQEQQEKEMIELAMQMSLHDSSLRLDDSFDSSMNVLQSSRASISTNLQSSRTSISTKHSNSSRYSTSSLSARSNRVQATRPSNTLFMTRETNSDRVEREIHTSRRETRVPVNTHANPLDSAFNNSMNLSRALENETDPARLEELEMEMLQMALHKSRSEW